MDIIKARPWVKLAPHFAESEFACRCCGMVMISMELISRLEKLRQYIGRPVIVSSGYRCPRHNQVVGGAVNSFHMKGLAADIYIVGYSAEKLATVAEWFGFDGLGVYRQGNFIHVDVRGYRARW
ncbi:YcbK family protein [Desulforamulus aquiferis]|uniref:D-Ala-D-Ala carboxypeptidase family metallohydrolase n=1 Tax=Desulforamulus aquiferis TaxID=1397668 RepID=A0AAW7ZF55_9FIRM|nr:D-Ala-D-Ala carboxypeptidase family metallohydrolase [Desulforamulus aquiferis]MDO7787882.1 D-Ala-D-Ala carboxypeptidase family metallohydrolase [Desulforamulus aquiferis]